MNKSTKVSRERFLSDGYVVARGIIDLAALTAINEEIGELFAIQLRRLGLPVERDNSREAFQKNALRLLKADVSTYIATARLTQMLPSVHRLLICDQILDLARELGIAFPVISTRVSIHIMSDVLKIPNGYHKSPPHQDWRSMQGSLDSIVLWLPTTPVSVKSHPLEVLPKSHLFGLLETVDHIMTPTVSDPRIADSQYVPVPMELGDIIAFSSFLVHRTSEEGDGLTRIALSGRFNNALEQTYVAHGYPTPYKYSYQTDLIVKDFPVSSDLAKVFPEAR
jgi:phytanoyl-CoA hydroxylase